MVYFQRWLSQLLGTWSGSQGTTAVSVPLMENIMLHNVFKV
jgi:hypothetical protein